jgi:putative addiction module component (TIGR02574 family)
MNARSKSIAKEAQGLPAADRIRLVEFLLASLDKPDPDIDRIWAEESERRLDAYLRGEVTARDAKEVLAKHLKP